MAQVGAVDLAGTGDFEFAVALAKASAAKLLARFAHAARRRGDLCVAATAVVSRLVSAVIAAGILFQPVCWPLRAGDIFYFHNHAARIFVAAGWQGFVAA